MNTYYARGRYLGQAQIGKRFLLALYDDVLCLDDYTSDDVITDSNGEELSKQSLIYVIENSFGDPIETDGVNYFGGTTHINYCKGQ